MGRRKENFRDEGIAGIIILSLLIYGIITIALWLIIITASALILFIAYQLSSIVKKLWIKILIGVTSILIILFGGSEVLVNYGKINKSILEYSIEKAQDFRLLKSNKGNYKVKNDYGTLIQTKN